jgi:type IV secretion system protein VirD4
MGIGRGYGLRIWPVLQDLNQLKELYPQRWETFLSNAGAQMFFAPRDLTTAKWVSDRTGFKQVMVPGKSVSQQIIGQDTESMSGNWNYGIQQQPAMRSDELFNLGKDEMILFGENLPGFVRSRRRAYWKTPEYKQGVHWNPDPYHT